MVIIKSFDSSSVIQKPRKLSSSSNSSWTTNSLDSMVFTDWGALQESPCCHSWGSCGQAFTEEGSHTQEVSSIKLILFMDWLVSHHGGIKIWSCFEPIWFCDCGHGLWLLQCQAIFEHAFFFFPGITARRCPSNSARLVLHRRKLTSWSSRVTVKMRKRMTSELVSWNKFPLKSRISLSWSLFYVFAFQFPFLYAFVSAFSITLLYVSCGTSCAWCLFALFYDYHHSNTV